MLFKRSPLVLVCVPPPCLKRVKVNTPHLWFYPLTHSQWKSVLFIFQTASRISESPPLPSSKKKPLGRAFNFDVLRRETVKSCSLDSCILYCLERNYKQPTGVSLLLAMQAHSQTERCWFRTKYRDSTKQGGHYIEFGYWFRSVLVKLVTSWPGDLVSLAPMFKPKIPTCRCDHV